jgi:hypothetical protein
MKFANKYPFGLMTTTITVQMTPHEEYHLYPTEKKQNLHMAEWSEGAAEAKVEWSPCESTKG